MRKVLPVAVLLAALPAFPPTSVADEAAAAARRACAKFAEDVRSKCEDAVRKAAPCRGLTGEERRQCLIGTGAIAAPRPPPDPCARAHNRAYCEAHVAAKKACADREGAANQECVSDEMRLVVADCERMIGLGRVRCELWQETVRECGAERGSAFRDCTHQRRAESLRRSPINPLDCDRGASPRPERCALRERVIAACDAHAGADLSKCRHEFLYEYYEPGYCSSAGEPWRGYCELTQRALGVCRGKEGDSLRQCRDEAVRVRYPKVLTDCTKRELDDVETRYCRAHDKALADCLPRFDTPPAYRQCAQDAIPAPLVAEMWATSLKRPLGPVR